MTDMGCNGFSLGMNLKRQRRYFFFNPNTDKTMIQTYQILPVVAIVCSASALAQNAADPVQMVKQNVDLISSANKVLDDVKDNAAVEIAIKQLNALTQQAKQLDKAMEKMKLRRVPWRVRNRPAESSAGLRHARRQPHTVRR